MAVIAPVLSFCGSVAQEYTTVAGLKAMPETFDHPSTKSFPVRVFGNISMSCPIPPVPEMIEGTASTYVSHPVTVLAAIPP